MKSRPSRFGVAAVALAMLLSGCASHIRTYRLTVADMAGKAVINPELKKGPQEGIVYALPVTLVRVEVPINATAHQKGDLFPVLPCFFPNIKDPSKFGDSGPEYSLGEPTLTTRGVADPTALFVIAGQGRIWEDQKLDLSLNGEMVPTKIDATVVDRRGDIAKQALTTFANLASRGISGGTLELEQGGGRPEIAENTTCSKLVNGAGNIPSVARCIKACESFIGTAGTTIDEFAQLLAIGERTREAIGALEDRSNLVNIMLANPVPADTADRGFAELDRTAKFLRGRFFGSGKESSESLIFDVDPAKCGSPCTLFKWEEAKGLCEIGLGGPARLLSPSNVPEKCEATPKPSEVSLSAAEIGGIPFNEIRGPLKPPTAKASGLVYRIPGLRSSWSIIPLIKTIMLK